MAIRFVGSVCMSLPGVRTQSPCPLLHPAPNDLFLAWWSLNIQIPNPHLYLKLAALSIFRSQTSWRVACTFWLPWKNELRCIKSQKLYYIHEIQESKRIKRFTVNHSFCHWSQALELPPPNGRSYVEIGPWSSLLCEWLWHPAIQWF